LSSLPTQQHALLSVSWRPARTQERNHGVPGAWITGDRILDVVLLPLVFAVLFPLLRVALVKYVFHVSGSGAALGCRRLPGSAAGSSARVPRRQSLSVRLPGGRGAM
jgi:hypothetical protein